MNLQTLFVSFLCLLKALNFMYKLHEFGIDGIFTSDLTTEEHAIHVHVNLLSTLELHTSITVNMNFLFITGC